MRCKLCTLIMALAGIVVSSALVAAQTAPAGEIVNGTIVARFDDKPVALPDITVVLSNLETGATPLSVSTNLAGRFTFLPVPRGTYQLCWRAAGWRSDCLTAPVVVTDIPRRLGLVAIEPAVDSGHGVAHGRVTLADATPCWFSSAFFGVDVTAHVSALDAGDRLVAGPVRVNGSGLYVLPGLPQATMRLRATCEAADAQGAVAVSARADVAHVDLTLPNLRPDVRGMLATLAGRAVRRVPPGATVDVEAAVTDRDADALRFSWATPEASGTVTPQRDGTATWALPRTPGLHTLYLLASDGKGGLTQSRLTLSVGTDGVFFSGTVTEVDGGALDGATVSVNGVTATTDARGVYSLLAAEAANDRYVTTVTKPGYVMLSRVFDNGGSGVSWRLARAHVTTVDPRRHINVVDSQGGRGRGHRTGARLRIPRNSLVEATTGAAPGGLLSLAFATLDPGDAPLPGDDGGLDSAGRQGLVNSFGAAYVDIRDDAGRRYTLKRGATAELTVPIAAVRLERGTRPPRQIPAWAYDGVSGYWRPDGTATTRNFDYRWDVTDLPGAMSAGIPEIAPGCLLVYVNKVPSLGLSLRATPIGDPALPLFAITGYQNLAFPLPPFKSVALELLDSNGDVMPNVQFIDGVTFEPLPSGIAQPGAPLKSEKFPYFTYCSASVMVSLPVPEWAGFPDSEFLEENLNPGAQGENLAQSYYDAVDPDDQRLTLGAWWKQNGFNPVTGYGPGGVDDTRASYLNTNELGVGRDVRCIQNGADAACYATHYGDPDGNPGNADLAKAAVKSYASWTLGMELRAVEGKQASQRIMKVFAFQGGKADSMRVSSVDLDGLGPRFVPYVCAVCHGGRFIDYNAFAYADAIPWAQNPNPNKYKTSPDILASFREFDGATLKPPSGDDVSAALATLNQVVKQANPTYSYGVGSAIGPLIDGWYQSPGVQDPNFVPPDWAGTPTDADFYLKVMTKSCRTCHIAWDSAINWSTSAGFVSHADMHESYVCQGRSMPNALMTYLNFWLSNRPALLKAFLGLTACP